MNNPDQNLIKDFFDTLSLEDKKVFQRKRLDTFDFGNDELLDLVRTGKKRATAGLLADHDRVPVVGDLGVIVDSKNNPQFIVEYLDIFIKPFLEVDFQFAQAEGEGFLNIEDWRTEHRKIFTEWTKGTFDDDSLILGLYFKIIYPYVNKP